MTRNGRIVGLAFLALATMAACAQASPKPSETTKATDTSKATEVAPQGQSAPTSKLAEPSFLDIMNSGKQAAYKVTYRISGTSSAEKMSCEQTWYIKPPKSRRDFSLSETGAAGNALLYLQGDGVVMCSKADGATTCLKMPKTQAMQQNQGATAQEQVQTNPAGFDVSYQGTREIAGQQGQCFAPIAGRRLVGKASPGVGGVDGFPGAGLSVPSLKTGFSSPWSGQVVVLAALTFRARSCAGSG